ncbi:uncharacterized protein LOC132938478 [Metopolophium dirhodum]|uniref:uncharacterized protein LOC132938478 n=1 Tax=Metopolophium dirhodum TaxID=44670 RepID=UPI0029906CBA|nr:uncharacterized protein LOC132938478 [Metopolophium dirhodum]
MSLDQLVITFNNEQKHILSVFAETDEVDEFIRVDEDVTETMQSMCDQINVIVAKLKPNNSIATLRNNNRQTSVQSLVLPRIEIPKFDGNIIEWCSFRDMFTSLVHVNEHYTDIKRFHYLLCYLLGPALTIVKAVPLTADNYSIAWNALKDRYDNKRLLVTAHIEKLFAFAPLTKESPASLSLFVNTFRENVSAIQALGVSDFAGFLLFYIGSRVIDPMTRRLFEATVAKNQIPDLNSLLDFVSQRCNVLENVGSSSGISYVENNERTVGKTTTKKIQGKKSEKTSLAAVTPAKTKKCLFCGHPHAIYKCFGFRKQPVSSRRDFVNKNQLCFVCLNSGHMSNACPTSFTCRICSSKHSTLLHLTDDITKSNTDKTNDNSERATTSCNATQFSGVTHTETTVLLGTVVVRVRDNTGVLQAVRAVLDSGSQVSAMTVDCVNRLGLTRRKCPVEVIGLSQQPVTTVKGQTNFNFVPVQADSPEFKGTNVIVLPRIMSTMPNRVLPAEVRDRYRHLVFADPQFDHPAPVDMLIGGDLYPSVIQSRADVIHTEGLPSAMNTQLGWVIIGALQDNTHTPLTSLSISTTPPIEELMQRFWTVEEPTESTMPTTQDKQCEGWFVKTTKRDATGRFYVGLPFRTIVCFPDTADIGCQDEKSVVLGSSRTSALNRLYNLERRLEKDPELYTAYRAFMDDYRSLGHMKLATEPGKYFIPHHPVVKRCNEELKIRVVFDASAKSSSGVSLNDCLVTGPKLQTEIGDVLLRSRLHKFVFTADITKMYRQICLHEPDRVYQHILWRNSPSDEVQEYELCTVTYGVSSAPFLAIRCLQQLNMDDGPEFPLVHDVLLTDTYVDDIFVGADTLEDVLAAKIQIIDLLNRGGFSLKKWASNCPEILNTIDIEDRAMTPWIEPTREQPVKVLGVHWDPVLDTFSYHSTISQVTPTKRSVLSTVARFYDPIGALGPMVFWAKCLMQRLWMEKLDWDAPLSSALTSLWQGFIDKLPDLACLSLPRHIAVVNSQDIQLLGFAEASQVGYAATVYLRVVDQSDNVRLYFLACKTKVAPLKSSSMDMSLTIPRLELCAALLLSRLLSLRLKVLQGRIKITRVRAWTDSTIVLSWLTAEQRLFKIFVTNRVSKIRNLVPQCEWAHVGTADNPADPASRGLLPDALVACSSFLHGPEFLQYPEEQWPVAITSIVDPAELPDFKRPSKNVLLAQQVDDSLIQRFSVLRKMQRVLAYCLRFVDKARQRPVVSGPIIWKEYENVLTKVARYTQRLYYAELHHQLGTSNSVITPSSLAQLAPFVDAHGVIRVGGRLQHSDLNIDAKHPILLPKSSHLAYIIIQHYHQNTLHGGSRLVASLIQRRFWIVSSRAAIRQVIFKCTVCVRYKAAAPQPVMADLPSARVQQCRPFTNVGMDYGGPFTVKESQRRNSRTYKAYLALFICLSTKAVHLEVVTDLSTEAFMAALDRFVARRGIPAQIHSDCGTNYIGAARQLKTLFKDAALQEALHARVPCQWRFNPPAAPHFGGIWEAAIKSTKLHLKKVVGNQVHTLEELTTLITRIEGVLNSRPLVVMSSDPNDLSVLTPGHFLIGQPILAIPEHDISDIPQNRLKRWQLIKQALQSFWKRWNREYLHTLQSRQKWFHQNPSLGVGDIVVINSPFRPPLMWQIGRVIEVHPGADQVVRVATVKTAEGILKRPVVKLVKLPTDNA